MQPPTTVPIAEHDSGRGNYSPSADQDLTVRRADSRDVDRIAALFHLVYADSSHPFQMREGISLFLADARNVQIVAEHEGQIIASMAMTHSAWNDSYELGRAITHPEYRRHGLAGVLMQQVVDWVCECAWGDVFFGFPRVRRIVELCAGIDPPMVVAGHDAARNVANGSRETHLIVYSIPRHTTFQHVTPLNTALMQSWFVQRSLYEPLGLRQSPGEYPAITFVGEHPPMAHTGKVIAFDNLLLTDNSDSPNHAVEIVGEYGERTCQGGISQAFDRLLRLFPRAEHITATVLADKSAVIASLCEAGFEVTAYLPCWFSLDGSRYDCVQLARRRFREQPLNQGLETMLAHLEADIRSSLMPALTRWCNQPHRRKDDES